MPSKAEYWRRKSNGRCANCTAPPAPGFILCENCRSERIEYHENLIRFKVCIVCCSSPAIEGMQKCQSCTDRINRTRRERYAKRGADGKCKRCGKVNAVEGKHCCKRCLAIKCRAVREAYHTKRLTRESCST